jgi:hypothetical protein
MKNHDAGWREDRAAELAHIEHEAHLAECEFCEACGAPLGDARFECDGYAVCEEHATKFAAAFLPEILAASKHAVDAYTAELSEPTHSRWA